MKKILLATSSMQNNIKAFGEAKSFSYEEIHAVKVNDSDIEFDVEVITLPGPTRNGVLYPLEEFKKAISDQRVTDLLNRGAFYGEDRHPENPENLARWTEVDMSRVSHKFTKLWIDGNKLMGRVRTYGGNGNLLAKSILSGELPAFSIRVIGAAESDGDYTRLSNIILIAIDWVRYPGNPTSYVNSSDAFSVVAPLIKSGFSYGSELSMVRAESATVSTLGINPDKYNVVSTGYQGYHVIEEKINNDAYNSIMKTRLEAFE